MTATTRTAPAYRPNTARLLLLAVTASLLVAPSAAADPDAVMERLSLRADGSQSPGDAGAPAMSSDGRVVAFSSSDRELVPAGALDTNQLYVRAGTTTELLTVSSSGEPSSSQGTGWPEFVTMNFGGLDLDADGSRVVFVSRAVNLTDDPVEYACSFNFMGTSSPASCQNVYLRDHVAGTTELVSVAVGGEAANGVSKEPRISDDGRFVVFESQASNLVPGDDNGVADIFLRDLLTGETTRVSEGDGTGPPGPSSQPAISADGRWVAFASTSRAIDDAAPPTPFGASNLFVHDRVAGSTRAVALPSVTGSPQGGSSRPGLSGDGRLLSFMSSDNTLVADDTNPSFDVFVHDRQTGQTVLVNRNADGMQSTTSGRIELSDDGRVALFSGSGALTPDAADDGGQHYLRELSTGRLQAIPRLLPPGVPEGNGPDTGPYRVLSADGSLLVYSTSDPLVADDTNGSRDVFRQRLPAFPAAQPPGSLQVTVSGGETVQTGATATPDVPVIAQITVPSGVSGPLSVTPQPTGAAPGGYAFLGQQLVIEGPVATATDPYILRLIVDASVLGAVAPADVQVFRDAVPLDGCTQASGAVPDPCIVSRGSAPDGSGDAVIEIRTSRFSTWSVGRLAYQVNGPLQPTGAQPAVNTVQAGAAVPIRFRLGGDRGMDVFAAGHPRVVSTSCGGSGEAVEAVSAGSSALTFDSGTATYLYVWKTTRSQRGCQDLVLRFRDGSELTVRFSLR